MRMSFCRIDGDVASAQDRQAQVKRFQTSDDIPVFLLTSQVMMCMHVCIALSMHATACRFKDVLEEALGTTVISVISRCRRCRVCVCARACTHAHACMHACMHAIHPWHVHLPGMCPPYVFAERNLEAAGAPHTQRLRLLCRLAAWA